MADERYLKTWVSDKLMSLMGYSQSVVVQYVIRLSKEASSPSDLVGKLVDYGFSSSADTRSFAHEIFAKVPHRQSAPSSYQKQEREAAQFAKKQNSYKLLDADDEDDVDNTLTVSTQQERGSAKKRFRKKGEAHESEDDDEPTVVRGSERNVRKRTSKVEESEDDIESEEAMLRDQEERAQLERNMKERDAAKTRQLLEPKLSKKEEEEILRRSKAFEENSTVDLRKVSREVYLKKRRDQKLLEIRDDIIDHEYIFEGVKLTDAEERELRYKKKIYELAKEHMEDVDDNEYKMPEAYDQDGVVNQEKRFAAAMQRYRDPGAEDKMNPFAEQEAWEEHQIGKATLKFGSKNKKQANDDYQYVFEDGIDFIKASVMDGVQYEDELQAESPDTSRAKSELQKLQDDRKTLPIYPYREELLQAVNDHQVHISLAGEKHMRITWVTDDGSSPSIVEYGTSSGEYTSSSQGEDTSYGYLLYNSGTIHHVVIGPLEDDTVYYYRCGGQDPQFQLKTPPSQFPVTFAVAGDLGQTEWTKTTLDHIDQCKYDMHLIPGDLSYADYMQHLWDSFGALVQPLASARPWMVTEGNHEKESILFFKSPFQAYNARWKMPYEESGSTSNLYYSFEAAGVHVIMLGSYTDYDEGSDQYAWLKEDLAKVDRERTPWLLVLLHVPWYNSNYAHQGEGDGMKASLEPLLYAAGVDILFAGHVHAYERSEPVYKNVLDSCGTVHVTIGDGGNREGLAHRYHDPKPQWSVFREASFGHGELKIVNETHAFWSWHRNDDDEPVKSDQVWINSLVSEGCIGSKKHEFRKILAMH